MPRPPEVTSAESRAAGVDEEMTVDFLVRDASTARSILQRFRAAVWSEADLSFEDEVLGRAGILSSDIADVAKGKPDKRPEACEPYDSATHTCTLKLLDTKKTGEGSGKEAAEAGTITVRISRGTPTAVAATPARSSRSSRTQNREKPTTANIHPPGWQRR